MFTPEFLLLVSGLALTVIGVVELIKKTLKVTIHWVSVVVSVVASVVVCIPKWNGDVINYAVLVLCVVLEANGLFKALHTSKPA